jgi:flagellar basal-body rod modification protein FlgD
MSGSITSTLTLTQAAEAAAAAGISASSTGISGTGTSSTGTSSIGTSNTGSLASNNALAQLGANFNQFLQLLLTQVQNQDPTAPTDTTQFTTELVQFTGVQEQVNTNTSLGQLIGLQQSAQVLQGSGLVGDQATVTANQITLQNGTGQLAFNGTAGEPVAISIVSAAGTPLRDVTLTANAGTNSWSWDGTDNNGNKVPDGAYNVAVETASTNGNATPLPFSVVGTATGISTSGTTTQLQLGGLSVPLSALQAVNGNK